MGKVIKFSKGTKALPLQGLTEKECAEVKAVADRLIEQGRTIGTAIHYDSKYMCVFDVDGEPILIGRQMACAICSINTT